METKTPKGEDLMKTLIKLLAEQEGVVIKYEIKKEGAKNEKLHS